MKTQDIFKTSSKQINESINKVFGKKLNLEAFDLEQLQDARNKLRTQVSQVRGASEFNENLDNDAFHQAQWMLDAINAEIAERNEHIIEPDIEEGRMSEIDIDLQTLANRGDEEDLIAALEGEMGPNVADVLQNMMEDLKDELASKGMNDVINDQDKMIEMLWDKIVDEHGGNDDYDDEGGDTDDSYALASAGRGSDEDYESIQFEKAPPGAKAERMVKHIKKGYAKDGKLTDKERSIAYATAWKQHNKDKNESVNQGEEMTKVTEGEIQQASAIVTAKTMVDRVGRWIEELSGMENDTLLQLGDSIRDEIGQEQAKAFIESVAPAIQQALETLKGTRDNLSNSVRTLATGEQPADMLGAEPAEGGAADMAEPAAPDAMNMPAEEPAADEFAAAEPAAGGAEAPGREQRESINYQSRLLKVLAG
jgi:hypothetical protein